MSQASRQNLIALVLALLLAVMSFFCCLGWIMILVLPGVLVAEGYFSEMDRGTLESLLLTPVRRDRIVWAKVLVRMRPMLFTGLFCLPLGVLYAWLRFSLLEDGPSLGWVLLGGTAGGVLAGLLIVGHSFTSGAFGLLFALMTHKRIYCYMLMTAVAFAMCIVVQVVTMIVGLGFVMLAIGTNMGEHSLWSMVLLGMLGMGLLSAWVLLVNLFLPVSLLRYASRNFDRLLLRAA